jgi:hypothetical protein
MLKTFALVLMLHTGADRVDSFILDTGLTGEDCTTEIESPVGIESVESVLSCELEK